MPGIDGFETCRRLRADPETTTVPVIFMTARTSTDDKVRGFEVGGVDYVTKPFEASELASRVQTHLQICALRREQDRHATELEERVAERTAALERELKNTATHQREREHLLGLVRLQSEQLRELTLRWMKGAAERDQGLAETLGERVTERLELVRTHLDQALGVAEGLSGAEQVRERLSQAVELLVPALEVSAELQGDLRRSRSTAQEPNPLLSLSTREYEVVQLMADGRSNKEIAYTLDVARSTVSTYRMRILEKLELRDTASLIRVVVEHGLPDEPPSPE